MMADCPAADDARRHDAAHVIVMEYPPRLMPGLEAP